MGQSAIASAGLRSLRSLHVSEATVKENVPKKSYMLDLPPPKQNASHSHECLGWDFPILKMVHVILVSDDWILEGWTLQVNSYCYRNIGSCNLSLARRFADSRWRTGVTFWGDYQWLSDGWSRSVLFKLNHKLIRALEVLHSESFFPWKYAYMAPKKGSRIIIFQASRLLGENSLNNFGGYELKKSS